MGEMNENGIMNQCANVLMGEFDDGESNGKFNGDGRGNSKWELVFKLNCFIVSMLCLGV